jgi:hypothetical protein
MLWAIVSSAFVIYLYRKLNAASDGKGAEIAAPANLVEQELASLDSRLGALEKMVNGSARRVAP